MRRVAKLSSVGPDVQNAFVEIWTRSKVLALRVGEPRTLARALRVLLPKCRCEKAVKLYRGEAVNRSRVHGFSWTSDPAIAEAYARNYKALEGGSVVLETIALPVAVIYVRKNIPEYYEESEYIVDPYRLGPVHVIARFNGMSEI